LRGIRPLQGSRFRIVAAVTVALVLLVGLVFPFIAIAHAERSIAGPDHARTNSSESRLVVEEQTGEESLSESPASPLGVRTLPLLSDQAYEEWKQDPGASIEAASLRLLPDPVRTFKEVARYNDSYAWWDPVNDFAQKGTLELGPATLAARQAVASNPPEEDVLDLIAFLLLLHSQYIEVPDSVTPEMRASRELLAAALAQEAALHYQTCDSKLTFAYVMSLVPQNSPDPVDRLFDAASITCGADVTPQALKAYNNLLFASEGNGPLCGLEPDKITPRSWNPVVRQFRQIQSAAPDKAAGWVGEADTYRVAADVLEFWGTQPFTVRAFRSFAAKAYGEAQQRSTTPEIDISVARLELASGHGGEALDALESLPPEMQQSSAALALKGRALASERRFDEAIGASQASDVRREKDREFTSGPRRTLRMDSEAYQPEELTGGADSFAWYILHTEQCGGASLAFDGGHTPHHRANYGQIDWGRTQHYAVLAEEWALRNTLCERDDVLEACDVLAATGNASAMSASAIDYYQDLLRSIGDLDRAAAVLEEWADANPEAPLAHDRLTEIRILQKRWAEAVDEGEEATRLHVEARDLGDWFSDSSGPFWTELRIAVAEREQGNLDEARNRLEDLVRYLPQLDAKGYISADSSLLMYAEQELGRIAFDKADYTTAIDHMERSIALGYEAQSSIRKLIRGVQAQVASASALELGDFEAARRFAQQAYDIDPYSPLFRESLAESERNLDKAAAIASYQDALAQDRTLFSTWNNMGVLLLGQGRTDEAVAAFESAVAARPDYATGWFNLGVAESYSGGMSGFVRSQGAFGKAAQIEREYRDHDRTPVVDEEIYDSGLDLSRPVPDDWELVSTTQSRPSRIGLGLILVVVMRIVWALGSDWLMGHGVQRVIALPTRANNKLVGVMTLRPWAVWTSAVSLGTLLLVCGVSGWGELLFALMLFPALLGAHALALRLRGGESTVKQKSSVPASLLSALLVPLGMGFTPPAPLADPSDVDMAVRRSGVVALGLLTVLLGAVAWSSSVPVARAAALAALLITSSALVPVAPLDGAGLSLNRTREVAVTVALGMATVLFAASLV